MHALGGMPMPGGWTMSMMWMRMPGQSWPGAAAAFLGMWMAMMAAMMLPSLAPMLRRYRQAVHGASGRRRAALTAFVCAGYFFVWSLPGLALFPLGVALARIEMRWPAAARGVPAASAVAVLIAAALQFTAWKARRLACCRRPPRSLSPDAVTAWRHGLRLGRDCGACCANLTAALLAVGMMDLRAMALVTAAITAERFAWAGERIAQAVGLAGIGAGLGLMVRAAGAG